MARGDPAFPLENLVPYFRGGQFAMRAIKMRGYSDPDLTVQVDRYIAEVTRYQEAVVATFRLRRERESGAGTSG